MKKDIRSFTIEELEEEVTSMAQPAHRARQIFLWLNGKGASDFSEMSDLSKNFVTELKKKFYIEELKCEKHLTSADGTEKFLWKLKDGEHIETVFISEGKRKTLCLSSQVGCKIKCCFCASGIRGFIRNLEASEIVSQVLQVQKSSKFRITNIVFMGMGEPFDNYDNVLKAIRIINHPAGIGIGARKITVSTCGITPAILKLAEEGLQVELSVSLHAANNELRNKLVPINRKYSLKDLLDCCMEYYRKTGRVITLEYALIKGCNDSMKDADDLAAAAKRLKAKVNLIACNPYEDLSYEGPDKKHAGKFKDRLISLGITATLRKSKGSDILAACGQLAAREG
ncbi:MAG: 23S rRNA (adenine(2503)-C(2))-methyltransferase RlmN [Candidatus Omnitrophica bacterium]|nr:23S rRNA (adenine(2503)-C(2))-methyltransferase RlmN [Candidatus Omnitrophota bacterium]